MKTFREYLAEANVEKEVNESKLNISGLEQYNMGNEGNYLILDERGSVNKNIIVLECKHGWMKVLSVKDSTIHDISADGKRTDNIQVDKAIIQIIVKFIK
jgi:hypothetical protein